MKRENSKLRLTALLLLLAGSLLHAAEEASPAEVSEVPPVQLSPPLPRVGERTAGILELQRSGLAAGREQPVSGEVASRSYQRYLDSFSQPLTERKDGGAASKPASSAGGSTPR